MTADPHPVPHPTDAPAPALAERIRIEAVEVLSDDWYVLKKTTFSWRRRDGTWQRQSRETYDRGNGATILLYDLERRTVVLVRQFRYPAYVNGCDDLLIETPAGLLDNADPEARIRAETEEETGFRIGKVERVFEAYMSRAPSPNGCSSSSPPTSPPIASRPAAAMPGRERTSTCSNQRSRTRWR